MLFNNKASSEIARAINDEGAIVGTATYTPTGTTDPIAAGSHGVMLLPCQYKLLNGDTNTADVDGVDFFGNRPTTRDYGYLSTDNASTAATISALGTNSLGALPLNNTYYSGAPVNSILVECMVLPSSSAITYSWHRSYRDCSAMIVHSGSNWNVTSANSTSNPSQESDDTGTSSVFTTSVSAKQLLYYADCPGANLSAFFNACQVN